MRSEPRLVEILVQYMDNPSLEVQSGATLALRNLGCDGECRLPTPGDILLTAHYREQWPESPSFTSCVNSLTLQPANDSPIVEARSDAVLQNLRNQ